MKYLCSICLLFLFSTTIVSQTIDLENLDTLTWTVAVSTETEQDVQTAISFRASGKRLDLDYENVPVTEASYYDDPLSACVALIRAGFTANENWWGNLSAPGVERETDGTPKSTYTADSDSNWYRFATAYTTNPNYPTPVGATVVSYLRIGGLHGFEVTISQVDGSGVTVDTRSLMAIREFSPGKFGYEPSWMGVIEPLTTNLRNTDVENSALASYRNSNPEFIRTVNVYKLYQGPVDAYPLTILFRAMAMSQYPRAVEIAALRDAIAVASMALPDDEASYENSQARQDLENLLTENSLISLDEQGLEWRKKAAFPEATVVVVDGGSMIYLGHPEGNTQTVTKGMTQLRDTSGQLQLENLYTSFRFSDFLDDDRVWGPLSAKLDEIIAAAATE